MTLPLRPLIYLLSAAVLFCVAALPANAKTPKDTLVMAMQFDDIVSLDPAEVFEFSGAEYTAQVYDRLVAFDLDDISIILPSVAESWTVSEDGKTFTFKIRQDITFHSGNPLTARDVAYSLQRVVKLGKTPAFILTQFGLTPENVDTLVQALDDQTVTFTTDQPYAPSFILYCLTANVASVVDSKLVESKAQDGDYGHQWLRTHSAGSGPFKLNAWRPNDALIYDRNDAYWKGKPGFKRVFIRHIAESSTQKLLLEKGDIDVARDLSADQLASLKDHKKINLVSRPRGEIMYLSLNVEREPFASVEGRQALKYLVDYQGIGSTLLDGQVRVHQAFLPVGFLGASEETPFSLNVEKAKDLLTAAGFPEGYKTTMDVRNLPELLKVAEAIQASFAQVGIEVEILPGDGRQVLTRYRAQKHDMHLGQWGPDYQDPHTNAQTFAANPDPSENSTIRTLAWRNKWDAADLTPQTSAAVLERDPATRAALYMDIQRAHQQTSPFIIMFQRIAVIAERKNVDGLIWGPSFDTYFYWQGTKN